MYEFVEVIWKEETATTAGSWSTSLSETIETISIDRKMHEHNEPFDINRITLEEYVL